VLSIFSYFYTTVKPPLGIGVEIRSKNKLESIEIIFDLTKVKAIYARYFNFERSRALKKVRPRLLFVVSGLLIFFGLFLEVDVLWIIGLIVAVLTGVFLTYIIIRFEMAYNAYLKEIVRHKDSSDRNFQFSFDSDTIKYVSKNMNAEMKWEMIKSFKDNGTDLYLFRDNKELLDIISETIIGEERFEKFGEMLSDKVNIYEY
jgi:hypothetical protein